MKPGETDDRGALGSGVVEGQAEFDQAFEEAQGIGSFDATPAGDKGAVPDPNTSAKPADGNANGQGADNGTDHPDHSAPQPGAAGSGDGKADDDQAEQRYRTLQGIHKHDRETWEQEKQGYEQRIADLEAKSTAPAPAPAPSSEHKGANAKPEINGDVLANLSAEDQAALKEYDIEFDTISKMESIKRKAESDRIIQYIDDKVNQLIQSISPVIDAGTKFSRESHFDAIRSAHEDFEVHRDNGSIKNWIETKPAYLKDAYMKAYNTGSPEEVIDLITTFKQENNIASAGSPPPQRTLPPPNPQRESKKAALSAVTNRRGAVNTQHAPADDFEGAFEEATSR